MTRLTSWRRRGLPANHAAKPLRFLTLSRRAMLQHTLTLSELALFITITGFVIIPKLIIEITIVAVVTTRIVTVV